MERKNIIRDSKSFEFFLDENLNMWRLLESPFLITDRSIDLEIDLRNIKGDLSWKEIEDFIDYLSLSKKVTDNITDAQRLLHTYFSVINKTYDIDFLKDIVFNLSGIDYKGYCNNVNLSDKFEYDLFFFPQYAKDIHRDVGSFVWRANFRDTLLLGVYCDRL